MANVIPFPDPAVRRSVQPRTLAKGEVVIFPGVRVEYHDDPAIVDLSCRIQAQTWNSKTS